MLFNSFEFLIFFPIVTILYFVMPYKFRWAWLLAASCYFYMTFIPIYILILGFTIVIDYFAGLYIEKTNDVRKKKLLLIISLLSNISILGVFKYYNFINETLSFIVSISGHQNPIPFLKILLPIGLSFHTFQAMSYTIEVYRGNQKAEKHFGIYALYVMFYPQLVAGPIERPQNMLHQFQEKHYFNYERATDGLKLMLWGVFKKVVIADRLSIMVNEVYNHVDSYQGIPLILATVFFAFQIYCDFSGYSDIALGSAEVMGFKLMQNFNTPYFAKSIGEFWTRWHISLSTWFRDYLYIPLGGNRVTKWRWYSNLFVVFLVSGLWHGANWTFVIWGALHGLYQILGVATQKIKDKVQQIYASIGLINAYGLVSTLVTFTLVCFAWIFFRANSFADAFYIVKHLSFTSLDIVNDTRGKDLYLGIPLWRFFLSIFGIVFLLVTEYFNRSAARVPLFYASNKVVRWGSMYMVILAILILGYFETNEFIYFQF